ARLQTLVRVAYRPPCPAIPQQDRSSAIISLGDDTLEGRIIDWVVLGSHCKPLVPRIEAGSPGHRPAFQDAVQFKPQIIVQPPGVVFLDCIKKAASGS